MYMILNYFSREKFNVNREDEEKRRRRASKPVEDDGLHDDDDVGADINYPALSVWWPGPHPAVHQAPGGPPGGGQADRAGGWEGGQEEEEILRTSPNKIVVIWFQASKGILQAEKTILIDSEGRLGTSESEMFFLLYIGGVSQLSLIRINCSHTHQLQLIIFYFHSHCLQRRKQVYQQFHK